MDKNTNDNELLFMIEENNEEAFELLIERYNPTIYSIINKYKTKSINIGLDISDLYQEGLIGLINAVKTYSDSKEASFKTYANLLIERQISFLVRKHNRVKYRSLNDAISLDSFTTEEKQDLYNIIDRNDPAPESMLINEENEKELKSSLADFELKVFELKLDGKTNKEISIILDKPIRSVENTLQRVKQKLKTKESKY